MVSWGLWSGFALKLFSVFAPTVRFMIASEQVFKNARIIPYKVISREICLEIPLGASVWSESYLFINVLFRPKVLAFLSSSGSV
jgi:hypothetical protein